MRITTARLVIDRLVEGDRDDLMAVAGDPRVAPNLGSFPSPCPADLAQQVIARSQDFSRPGYRLAVRLEGIFAGTVGLSPVPEEGAPTVGYFLAPDFWGRGLMGEALDAFLPIIEARHELVAIEASAFEDNPASRRLLERRNFRPMKHTMDPSKARVDLAASVLYRREREALR